LLFTYWALIPLHVKGTLPKKHEIGGGGGGGEDGLVAKMIVAALDDGG
jgi:hypothetical protein